MTLDEAKLAIESGIGGESAARILDAIAVIEKEAERYRFLRNDAEVHPDACPLVFWANKHGEARKRLTGADLDAEIDESRSAYIALGYTPVVP